MREDQVQFKPLFRRTRQHPRLGSEGPGKIPGWAQKDQTTSQAGLRRTRQHSNLGLEGPDNIPGWAQKDQATSQAGLRRTMREQYQPEFKTTRYGTRMGSKGPSRYNVSPGSKG